MDNPPFIDDFPQLFIQFSDFPVSHLGFKTSDVPEQIHELDLGDCLLTFTDWWFGTWLSFFHMLGMSSSQLTKSYFSEG